MKVLKRNYIALDKSLWLTPVLINKLPEFKKAM
jgi:hypothetical protein